MSSVEVEQALQAETFRLLAGLRKDGWSVAVHNDYVQKGPANGEAVLARTRMTFWLLTHEPNLCVKGEGLTDLEALTECAKQARQIFAPSP